ncbi:MAG: flagellar M-ring protein FliF [Solirubrobacteraceae bacterium]|jgi:flagellar M-ring protein FliF|nr:flagellar M-ring protein FliF [Solirubrobacteraceae bacterium]
MQLLQSLSTRGKITLAGCALAFVVVAMLLVRMASAPSYTQIMAGLDPAQTGKISTALDSKGIKYEIRSNGTQVAVEKAQVGAARIALAEQGLNSAQQQPGFELLDKQKLGASNFQQQVAYQRALEGQIANTIGQIDGVSGAQVSLTLPKDQLFADQQQPATAAVLLGGGASTLEPGAVRGIANLVASSVQGLKTANVTITDGSGSMLWPAGDGTGTDGTATSKQAAQARYDQSLSSSINAMLASTLGAGKAQVQVTSDLNVDQATQDKLQYAKNGVPLQTTKKTETLTGSGGPTGAPAGTGTNIPSYAQTAAGANGKSNYKSTDGSTTFGVDKTVTRTKIAPGQVNKLSVAVLVDPSALVDAAGKPLAGAAAARQLATVKQAVGAAAGIQAGRDQLVVTAVPFAKAAAPAASAGPIPAGMLGYVKNGLMALGALLFLFFVTRFLRKRESGAFADEPSWLRELQIGPRPALAAASGGGTGQERFDPEVAAREIFNSDPKAVALDELVKSEPDKVAQQLRTWITEDGR